MDDCWDDAALSEQLRLLRQERQGQVSGAPKALAGKRSATALGLGRGRSRRRTSDMRTAAPTKAAASSVALAAVARGARGRRLAHAGTGHCHGASAQLAPKRRGALDKAAAAQTKNKAKAKKAKENANMAKAKKAKANKAKADKAKAAKANKATTTAKATATAHSSETRVAPTAALLPFPNAGLRGVPQIIRVRTECSGMELVAMALRNLGVLDQCSLEFCCEINKWCKSFIMQNHPPKRFFDDITLRDPKTTPPCDLYVAGFPCQPFSRAGLRQGTNDATGRGSIFDHIIPYLRAHRPRAVILENVAGLKELFAETFNENACSGQKPTDISLVS